MPAVRYMVRDVPEAVAFYTTVLGFDLADAWGDVFARVERDGLELWLAGPETSAARSMPDGRKPEPGGWNRIVVETGDIEALVSAMREQGVGFRNEVIGGPGGSQVLIEDPSGNPIEIFQPR